MKKLLVILFLLMPILGVVQSKLYHGNSTYSGDVLYTVKGRLPFPILLMLI